MGLRELVRNTQHAGLQSRPATKKINLIFSIKIYIYINTALLLRGFFSNLFISNKKIYYWVLPNLIISLDSLWIQYLSPTVIASSATEQIKKANTVIQ